MIGRRDYVEIVGAVSRRIAAEKYIGTVELETVEKSVEDLRRNQVPGNKHVRSLERPRIQHLLSLANAMGNRIREREREMTSKQKVVESLGIFICRFGGERILKSGEM
jgi:hypothetical protein